MASETWWKTAFREQAGGAIAMVERAVAECPDEVWSGGTPEFWYIAFHVLFWADFSASPVEEEFRPPAPFSVTEMDPAGVMPDRVYTKEELLEYARYVRRRTEEWLAALTEESAAEPCGFARRPFSRGSHFLYNLRHLQHHAGQLHLLLRQGVDRAPRWVGAAPLVAEAPK